MSAAPTALITGAATGIGLAASRILTANGWKVLGTALPGQDASALRETGAEALEVDLTNSDSITHLIDEVNTRSRLDALLSNAGVAIAGPLEGLSTDELRLQFQLNAIAPIQLARAVLPQLRERGGRMVFIGAGQGRTALPFGGSYGASKAALASLTDALRAEVACSGVHVSLLEPGAVRTDILSTSEERSQALLARLPHDLAHRYREPMQAIFARSERAFRKALEPEKIGRLVLQVLTTPAPKPRYLVGTEAVGLAALALLPARLRATLVAHVGRPSN